MNHNPILEELYAIRERLLADAGGDIHKLLDGIRDREAASGRLLGRRKETESESASCLASYRGGPAGQTAEPGR